MPDITRRRLRRTTAIYWLLLIYIVAALVWWFISLNTQNTAMRDFEVNNLRFRIDSTVTPVLYQKELNKINNEHKRNKSKYLGEGFQIQMVSVQRAVSIAVQIVCH